MIITEKKNILIVDDNPENIQVITIILKAQGYKISSELDGNKVLQHLKSFKADLILLDIIMPEINGYEVCRQLKDDPETKDIPIIFLSAKSEPESIIRGFEVGCVDYITKPFNSTELLARVNTHLKIKRHRDHLEVMVRERTQTVKVIMQICEEISTEMNEKITSNITCRIFPMISTLRETLTKSKQKQCLGIIESRLGAILSDSSQKLSSPALNLTPAEIQIAGLVRDGKTGKQITMLLGISENTLNFHRTNIRKKLGLNNLKTGLKSFLQKN
jgi:DNA-binding response OmpR family regulator/DNA-binding CsgD family transcriptional regulator